MSEVFIRIDGRLPRERLQRFLQALRDAEQAAPDEIHLALSVLDDDGSWREHLGLLRKISPGLPHEDVVYGDDASLAQREAGDRLRATILKGKRKVQ